MLATRLELDLIATGGAGGRARAVRGGRRSRCSARTRGDGSSQRLRRLAALQALDVPIVLLVGGATGTGKSTVATEAAHRLGITRVTSTDFIRQTIRAYFPPPEMPSVHVSSFEAGGAAGRCEAGFLEQTRTRARRRRGLDRAGAQRGLVDGDRGRPPRARASSRPRSRARSSSTPSSSVESVEEHREPLRRSATRRPAACAPLEKYLDGLAEIRALQDADRRARRALRRAGDREHDRRGDDGGAARPRAQPLRAVAALL